MIFSTKGKNIFYYQIRITQIEAIREFFNTKTKKIHNTHFDMFLTDINHMYCQFFDNLWKLPEKLKFITSNLSQKIILNKQHSNLQNKSGAICLHTKSIKQIFDWTFSHLIFITINIAPNNEFFSKKFDSRYSWTFFLQMVLNIKEIIKY